MRVCDGQRGSDGGTGEQGREEEEEGVDGDALLHGLSRCCWQPHDVRDAED